jgi:predicted metal-binding membrane protein
VSRRETGSAQGRVSGVQAARTSPDRWLPPLLLVAAGVGWWWSAAMARAMRPGGSAMDMAGMGNTVSFGTFLLAWVAMMAAMMLPAVLPVVRLYARAAAGGRAAPVPVFVAGYLLIWSSVGVPVYFLWRGLEQPLTEGAAWAGRLAGVVLVTAAVYQLTPLKAVCLRHCRSPLGFFLHHGRNLDRPGGALAAGARHGLYCLGCCWLLMGVLVAFGTMQLVWMACLAALIVLEKVAPFGEGVARTAGAVFLVLGVFLLAYPTAVAQLT